MVTVWFAIGSTESLTVTVPRASGHGVLTVYIQSPSPISCLLARERYHIMLIDKLPTLHRHNIMMLDVCVERDREM